MNDFIKKYSKDSLLVSAVLIILALFLIFKPGLSINIVMTAVGIVLAFYGVVQTYSYFSHSKEIEFFNFQLVFGLLGILAGLVFIFNPTFIYGILPLAIGLWIVVKSVTSLQLALNIKNSGGDNWQLMLILSLLTLVLGIVIVVNPFEALEAAVSICGGFLLVSELINLFETVYMLRMMK
ncbi:MAG: DUF308 domain-containing protein [Clostridia bacterium]|nr:DUF308 domain-containing protein [Clostridia bacterium]